MNAFPRWLMALLALAMLVLLAGGAWFYRAQERQLRLQTEANLMAIAQWKAEEIGRWRVHRIGDAAVMMKSPLLLEAARRWLASPDGKTAEDLLTVFNATAHTYGYRDVWLVDAEGQVRLSLMGYRGPVREEAARALAEAFRQRSPYMNDLHSGPGNQPPHLEVVAPIFARKGEAIEPIGAVILQSEGSWFLYPLIESWPVPTRTAETVLVRRDGDAVLFLNDLRHQNNTALKLHIPLSQTEVPAVMAVLGKEGVVQGKDYRGVDVLAALKAVPGSPWFVVAKVDTAEAFAAWRFRSVLILLLILGLVAAAGAAVGLVWQANQKAHYRALFEAEAARRRSEERHRATLMSVGDGVIATDAEGRVEMLNPVAETLTGWRENDAQGRPLEEVFRIINEDTRQTAENPVQRVLREGIVVGLANHSLLIARDGTERPIADSGAPIRDDQGRITGVVLVFSGQTEERAAQKRLLREKQRAQQYLDLAGVMMIALDAHANVVLVNRKGCEILGCPENEILGKNWFEHFVPDRVRERVSGVFARMMAGQGEPDEYVENRVLTRSGDERLFAWHNAAVKDESGTIIGTLSSGDDITEDKRAEEALRESEERYRALFENAPVGVYRTTPDGRVLAANPALIQMLGYSSFDELAARNLEEEGYEADYPRGSFKEQIEREGEVRGWTGVWTRRDGSTICISENARVVWGADRTVLYYEGTAEDITERKRAEEALRESEERFRRLYEQAPIAYQSLDADGNILDVNSAWLAELGYERGDVIGKWFGDFLTGEGPALFIERFPQFKARGETHGVEYEMKRKIGDTIAVSFDGRIARDEKGGFLQSHCVFTNITERKRAEEEKKKLQAQLLHAQKMEAVGRLAGGVAHDFNNMLQAILGNTELALEGAGSPGPLHESLVQIQRAAQRSADLTRQLLAFARKQIVSPRTLDLNDTVSGILKLLRRLIGEDIDLAWMPGHDLWSVRIDPSQIDQVLANLAVNARDAIAGVGRVTIETTNVIFDEAYAQSHVDCVAGQYVLLAISDTGRGMDKHTLGHLFEPFFTTKDVGKGTGLGLATVYGIVKQNGGLIDVYSEPGHGTIFKIYLPRFEAEPVEDEAGSAARVPRGGSETLLIVEDEAAILNIARRTLEGLGYTVLTAGTPGEAIRLAGEHAGPIHLLVTDVVMPEMNGRELAESLNSTRPGLKRLYMSGYTADVIANHGVLEEGLLFIQKPFTMNALAEKVREALDR